MFEMQEQVANLPLKQVRPIKIRRLPDTATTIDRKRNSLQRQGYMQEPFKKADFSPYMHDTFTVCSPYIGNLDVVLAELTEKHYPGQECFSVIFKGPHQPVLQQMLYTISHREMGNFQLFMVPVNYPKQDGTYYQSVFNRIIP